MVLTQKKPPQIDIGEGLYFFVLSRHHIHDRVVVGLPIEFLLSFVGVSDDAFFDGEDGKISSHVHTLSWEPVRALLTDDDVSRSSAFSTEELHTTSLGIRIAIVLGGTTRLFMSHSV
jgi:hypothetical protein